MKPTQAQIEAAKGLVSQLDQLLMQKQYSEAELIVARTFAALEAQCTVLTAAAEVRITHNHVFHGPSGRWIACDLTEKQIAAAEVRETNDIFTQVNANLAAMKAATIERCAQWHDKQEELMVEAQDLIAAEWHRDSAAAIRAIKEEQ